jgi:catechol 2,3-dioxygenase-like lactoylglutathione lyase family enzyme
MAVEFNHTLVNVRDVWASARSVAEILGLEEPSSYGPFAVVTLANGASIDFHQADEIQQQHYAFLVSESEFDEILGRIRARGYSYQADPFGQRKGTWNTDDGGRGLYWEGPDGHLLEIITRPYGSGG